jgi:hypothetical protein
MESNDCSRVEDFLHANEICKSVKVCYFNRGVLLEEGPAFMVVQFRHEGRALIVEFESQVSTNGSRLYKIIRASSAYSSRN